MIVSDVPAPSSHRVVARLVALVFFIQLLDGTIIATSLPRMAADFGVTPLGMSFGITAYLLAMTVVLPATGWAGERFGARPVLVASLSVFTCASLACGLAGGFWTFIAARVVQGAAAALMAPVGRMLVLRHAPKSELIATIATITWPALFAPLVGPVLGAWITETIGWRWNFFMNVPLGLVSVALFLALAPQEERGAPRPFDRRGFALCAGGLLLLLGGLEIFASGRPPVEAFAGMAAGVGVAFAAVRHLRVAPHPLFDLAVCRIATFRMASMTAGTLGRTAVNATPFLLPLLFQVGFGLSPLESGQLLLVYFLGNLAMKCVTTPILRRFGFRRVLTTNGLLAALAIGLFAFTDSETHPATLWSLLFLAGAARSLQFTALNTLAFADVGASERASSSTLSAMTQQVAMLLGVALPVAFVTLSGEVRGVHHDDLVDYRAAFLGVAVLGAASAAAFARLAPDAGREVTGGG